MSDSCMWHPTAVPEDYYKALTLKATFVVLSPKFYWGRGKSIKEAAKNAHVSSLKDLSKCAIYMANTDKITVDDMGAVVWTENVTVIKIQGGGN